MKNEICAIIESHFDYLINEVMKRSEVALARKIDSAIQNSNADLMLTQVRYLKEYNVNLASKIVNSAEIEAKWNELLDKATDYDHEEKLDLLMRILIKNDAILVNDSQSELGCSLWITDWYNSRHNADFLKYLFA